MDADDSIRCLPQFMGTILQTLGIGGTDQRPIPVPVNRETPPNLAEWFVRFLLGTGPLRQFVSTEKGGE